MKGRACVVVGCLCVLMNALLTGCDGVGSLTGGDNDFDGGGSNTGGRSTPGGDADPSGGDEGPSANPPAAPHSPDPPDGSSGVPIGNVWFQLDWAPVASYYDVYFGTQLPLGPSDLLESRTNTSNTQTFLNMSYGTQYYWQVVSIDEYGSTPGPVWTFTTHASPRSQVDLVVRGGFRPCLSTDGSHIVFLRLHYTTDPYVDGQTDVWTVRVDGSGLQRITNTPENEVSPQWVPGTTQIAFIRTVGSYFSHDAGPLMQVNQDGSGETVVEDRLQFKDFCFYTGNGRRYTILVLSDGSVWMTQGSDFFDLQYGYGKRRDAYTATNIRGNPVALGSPYIAMNDTTARKIILWDPVFLTETHVYWQYDFPKPCLSPDGSHLVAGADGGLPCGLYVMGVDGTGLTQITDGADLAPSWQQNTIVFTRVPPDGRQAEEFGDLYTAGWVPE